MERRHEDQLINALDQLYLDGVISIRWDQIYLWLQAQRLGKASYREIIRRWEDLCTSTYGHASAPELLVFHWKDKPTLTLIRKPFDDEKQLPFSEWA